jgi:hypothetical protein
MNSNRLHNQSQVLRSVAAAGLGLAVGADAAPGRARAGGEDPRVDKSAYTLFNPTPRDLLRDLSTDRPDLTESPYTVDAGRVQVEWSFVEWSVDRRNEAGGERRALAVAPVLVKFGLLHNVDLQAGFEPWTRVRGPGEADDAEGFGDTLVRLKINLFGNDGGDLAAALMPFVSFPTGADGLSAGHVEGGLILPFAASLPNDWSLGLMAEVDLLRGEDRYVVDFVHTATIGRPIAGDLGGFVEYAGLANLNRAEGYRAYLNTGLTWGLTPDVQLDAGVRIGLTGAADDLSLFAGMSVRY